MRARILLATAIAAVLLGPSSARDNGQYAQSDPAIHDWFEHLGSKNGLCCSFADGVSIDDPDWRITASGKYEVFYKGQWRSVPPQALITEGNRIGRAILWPVDEGSGLVYIRCFMPGVEG